MVSMREYFILKKYIYSYPSYGWNDTSIHWGLWINDTSTWGVYINFIYILLVKTKLLHLFKLQKRECCKHPILYLLTSEISSPNEDNISFYQQITLCSRPNRRLIASPSQAKCPKAHPWPNGCMLSFYV